MPSEQGEANQILERILGVLEDIRDSAAAGSGGGAAAGASGRAARSAGSLGTEGVSGLAALRGGLGAVGGGVRALEGAFDATGVTAGFRTARLGGSGDAIRGSAALQFAETLTNLPFGSALFAQTGQALDTVGRAQGTVSGIAESVARAGGDLDKAGIRTGFKNQLEIEKRVTDARNAVANIAAEEGGAEVAKPALSELEKLFELLSVVNGQFAILADAIAALLGNLPGAGAR